MKAKKIVAILIVILGVVMLLIPKYIAPVCPIHDGGPIMKCHWMGQAVMGLGSLIAILGVLIFVVKDLKMAKAFSISTGLVSGLAISISTHLIGGCSHHHMSCRMHTIPAVAIVGGILVVLSLGYASTLHFRK